MSLPSDLQEIVDFIRFNSEKLRIREWTDEQIGGYILEKISLRQCIVIYESNKPAGVIFFRLLNEREMYVEQFWCSCRGILRKFLFILESNFPSVTTLKGLHQRRRREINFNVKQFIRIYGR